MMAYKNLKRIRRARGYKSAKEYANHLGIPTSTYSRHEQDCKYITAKQAIAFAEDLDVSIDYILDRYEWSEEEVVENLCPMTNLACVCECVWRTDDDFMCAVKKIAERDA